MRLTALFVTLVIMVVSCYNLPQDNTNTKVCICHKMYVPVCGSDGQTYGNICEFQCHADELLLKKNIKLQIVKEDSCDAPDFDE